jgi:hypothetical protein
VCFIYEGNEQISVKFDIVSLCQKLSGQFNFGLHWLNITPPLCRAQVTFYQFS